MNSSPTILAASFFLVFLISVTTDGFSQTINPDYFPSENPIDRAYSADMKKWTTNSEWEAVVSKYATLWKNQAVLEKNRLTKRNLQLKAQIERSDASWESALEESVSLVQDNVDGNRVGRQPHISWLMEITEQYRQRAIYYFCLYYTILETTDPDYDYRAVRKLAE